MRMLRLPHNFCQLHFFLHFFLFSFRFVFVSHSILMLFFHKFTFNFILFFFFSYFLFSFFPSSSTLFLFTLNLFPKKKRFFAMEIQHWKLPFSTLSVFFSQHLLPLSLPSLYTRIVRFFHSEEKNYMENLQENSPDTNTIEFARIWRARMCRYECTCMHTRLLRKV